ncbi:Mobile element protein [Candidatus Enterovibrio escicola]|uniref:Mobile element protein n=1 Tax=Candidatus Enterovibrio escicola TaxID=1927127 RepID=A0A2A5T2S6_9GAMM|nr:Mobile element protein [Candidatus Enterovibrio escacola]
MLNLLRRKIQQVSTDRTYDTKACRHVLKNTGIMLTIPPQSTAGYWEDWYPRNEAIKALKDDKLAKCKK